jgi:hypothetical protein
MSIARCEGCGKMVDTDEAPLEPGPKSGLELCENCAEREQQDIDREGDLE